MRVLIVDDEHLARALLREYLAGHPDIEVVGECANGFEAVKAIGELEPELVFLDIQMPKLTGIDFLKSLPNPPRVIFTTAYRDYALDSYELNAVDYLLKPIPYDRFLKAVTKAQERLQRSHKAPEAPAAAPAPQAPEQDFMFVKADYKTVRVDFADILWIEGLKDYIIIQTKDHKIITLLSMNKAMEKLPESKFMRVHRSFIVALHKIDSIEKSRIRIGNKEIPIGEVYKDHFLHWVEENNIQ